MAFGRQLLFGYFELNFDFSEVDVSFHYEITISVSDDPKSAVPDLVAFKYIIDNDGIDLLFENDSQTISGDIILDKSETPVTVRSFKIYVMWDDESLGTLDNAGDTATTIPSIDPQDPEKLALLNVKVSFVQIPNPLPDPDPGP